MDIRLTTKFEIDITNWCNSSHRVRRTLARSYRDIAIRSEWSKPSGLEQAAPLALYVFQIAATVTFHLGRTVPTGSRRDHETIRPCWVSRAARRHPIPSPFLNRPRVGPIAADL